MLYLGTGTLAGVLPGLQRAGAQRRQLRLEHADASAGGRHELEGGLQGGAQCAVCLPALAERRGEGGQQVLDQLRNEGRRDRQKDIIHPQKHTQSRLNVME